MFPLSGLGDDNDVSKVKRGEKFWGNGRKRVGNYWFRRTIEIKDIRKEHWCREMWEPVSFVSFSRRLINLCFYSVWVHPSQQEIKMIIHAKFVLSVNKDYKHQCSLSDHHLRLQILHRPSDGHRLVPNQIRRLYTTHGLGTTDLDEQLKSKTYERFLVSTVTIIGLNIFRCLFGTSVFQVIMLSEAPDTSKRKKSERQIYM